MSDAAAPRRPLLVVVRPLVFAGWAIAAVRLLLDAVAPETSMWFGLYYLLPAVLLVLGVRGAFDDLRWGRLALAMVLTCFLVWAPTNAIAYTIAQFEGWTHGRFAPDRGPPTGETAFQKIAFGTTVGVLTGVAASVWMVVAATVLVWLPRFLRRRTSPSAGRPLSDGA